MKKFVATMLVVGLLAVVAQAGAVHYSFDETAAGTWTVSAEVTGTDTVGLSAYGAYCSDAAATYVQNTLSILGPTYTTVGFGAADQAVILGELNVGSFQTNAAAIQGVGQVVIDMATPPGPPPATLHLDAKALLGTFTTALVLGADDFRSDGAGLLNLANDGYLTELTVTQEVNPIPEPMTLSLLAIGGCLVAIKRKRS